MSAPNHVIRSIESLKTDIKNLRSRLDSQQQSTQVSIPSLLSSEPLTSPLSSRDNPIANIQIPENGLNTSPESTSTLSRVPKRSHFISQQQQQLPDFVSSGLITIQQAEAYIAAFFQGCHQYVPIFDPNYDTVSSIRARSSFLFGSICTVGCRVLDGTDSPQWRLLNAQLKRMINASISTPNGANLEAIQALLVRACYSAERSLLVAAAARMAVDVGLPSSYDELTRRCALSSQGSPNDYVGSESLMRAARTWIHTLVLGHILHVDAGDTLSLKFVGDVRRSRILLELPCATVLDRFLFAQLELNVLRAKIYSSLSSVMGEPDEDILDVLRDSKIDINLWYSDWDRIFHSIRPTPAWLLVNLQVQQCWAETMALCRAVTAAGVQNVDFMTETQKSILNMAKASLRRHLDTIITEPRSYLHNLRFAMDFVWAKCAFCYLLLLKLSALLPESDCGWNQTLIACGHILSTELSEAAGNGASSGKSSTSKLYLQILQSGIQKFSKAVQNGDAVNLQLDRPGTDSLPVDDGNDFNSFAPDQFLFEWDFPGLTLFSTSTTGLRWLDDIFGGALQSNVDILNGVWNATDEAPI